MTITDSVIVLIIGFVGSLIAIITPIIRLSNIISRLNTTIELFREDADAKHDKFDERITKHGREIDELEKTSVNHEVRITAIEDHTKEK